jgi:trimethylamine--corrinoid protein Co-methyltransferase
LAGANLIYGLGMIEMGMTIDYGQMVMDNEFARMIKYLVQGIPVNDETLAVDVIKEIGVGKDFLSHESTYKHMRTQSQPKLIDRRMREDWQAAGGTDIYHRALEEARYILENHKPDPLPDAVLSTIRSIVEEAEAELGIRTK